MQFTKIADVSRVSLKMSPETGEVPGVLLEVS
jgi:hypothetical protein